MDYFSSDYDQGFRAGYAERRTARIITFVAGFLAGIVVAFMFLLFVPLPARADDSTWGETTWHADIPFRNPVNQTSVSANQLAMLQAADILTTRLIISQGGYERDPIARPFVHSTLELVGAAVVVNVAARNLFRHSPTVIRILSGLEAVCVANNLRILSH